MPGGPPTQGSRTTRHLGAARCALVVLVLAVSGCARPKTAAPAAPITIGVGLGLFASVPDWDYGPLVAEIAALGATDVLVVVPWYQEDIASTTIAPRPGFSPSAQAVERTLDQARDAGLRVSVMPIVLLSRTAHPKQWRGVLAPRQNGAPAVSAWFASYRAFLLGHAAMAARASAHRLVVGSELLSMEGERAEWEALIAQTRATFAGRLLYSANWDHLRDVSFWDLLDEVGVNGYFRLAAAGSDPTVTQLVAAWEEPLAVLRGLRRDLGLPLVVTEVGYPSRVTAAEKAWCACPAEAIDHGLQGNLYLALTRMLDGGVTADPGPLPFDGVFLWNWFGPGGAADGSYSPRGKPSETIIRDWLRARGG